MAEKSLFSRTVLPSSQQTASPPTSKTYRGMSTAGATSGSYALYDIGLIKQDLINHFYIRQGEKLENPEFGCIIWDLLFDPLTEGLKTAIAANVTEIVNYDPRVRADSIVVSEFDYGIQIECELTYLPYNISETLRFRFDQDNGIMQ